MDDGLRLSALFSDEETPAKPVLILVLMEDGLGHVAKDYHNVTYRTLKHIFPDLTIFNTF